MSTTTKPDNLPRTDAPMKVFAQRCPRKPQFGEDEFVLSESGIETLPRTDAPMKVFAQRCPRKPQFGEDEFVLSETGD